MVFLQHISGKTHSYATINTPLGDMIAISNDNALVLLTFVDSLPQKIKNQLDIAKKANQLIEGLNKPLLSIKTELDSYFAGKRAAFTTPIEFSGTDFQKEVWQKLMTVKSGSRQTYTDLAIAIGNKKAVRAVAQANARNRFVIMVPCHRIIAKGGTLGGYSCGLARKQWLLEHEKNMK